MTRQPDAPRHIVTSTADADLVLRRLTRAGWRPVAGFTLPAQPWDAQARLVLHGPVTDRDTLHQCVLAATRGAAVIAVCDTASPLGRALTDDLTRLGAVQHGPGTGDTRAVLVPEQRALLERLAGGDTIAAAAAAEFLSLRTANRRIAEARAVFGVRTTREAVLAYLRQRGQP